jgi:hypothetical protein
MVLDKIRVSESTKTASKRPCSRRWVYQCRCWFVLASGYDWRSLGGEGKVTWMVIANKSGVEKQKKFCTEQWFFLVNFCTVPTNCFWKNWEFFLIVWIREKNDKKWEKINKIYKAQTWGKKIKIKIGIEVYICVYNTNGFGIETMYDYYIAMKSIFLFVKLLFHLSIVYASLTILLPWTKHKQRQNHSKIESLSKTKTSILTNFAFIQ